MTIYSDNSYSIGNTPLVRLKHFGQGNIVVKVEGRNPSFSVKCRIGANMVWQAEKDGILTKEKEIVDATSGNTGIALAYVAAARGYKITLTMPETMSAERKRLLRGLGVNLVLTEGALGMKGAIAKAEEIVASDPQRYVMLKQFENPANQPFTNKQLDRKFGVIRMVKLMCWLPVLAPAGRLQGLAVILNKIKVKRFSLWQLNLRNHR